MSRVNRKQTESEVDVDDGESLASGINDQTGIPLNAQIEEQ